jgi:hypothetical protein
VCGLILLLLPRQARWGIRFGMLLFPLQARWGIRVGMLLFPLQARWGIRLGMLLFPLQARWGFNPEMLLFPLQDLPTSSDMDRCRILTCVMGNLAVKSVRCVYFVALPASDHCRAAPRARLMTKNQVWTRVVRQVPSCRDLPEFCTQIHSLFLG